MVVFYGLHDVIEKQTNQATHETTQDNTKATHETTQDNTKATHVANKDTIERGIVEYCAIPRTKKEIANHFGFADEQGFAKRHLRPLVASNIIIMTIPDKPKSKNQKYVATKK
jgi:ATP-dependent DNA helicase RecG